MLAASLWQHWLPGVGAFCSVWWKLRRPSDIRRNDLWALCAFLKLTVSVLCITNFLTGEIWCLRCSNKTSHNCWHSLKNYKSDEVCSRDAKIITILQICWLLKRTVIQHFAAFNVKTSLLHPTHRGLQSIDKLSARRPFQVVRIAVVCQNVFIRFPRELFLLRWMCSNKCWMTQGLDLDVLKNRESSFKWNRMSPQIC